jgi:hypothetical protein
LTPASRADRRSGSREARILATPVTTAASAQPPSRSRRARLTSVVFWLAGTAAALIVLSLLGFAILDWLQQLLITA